MADSSSVLREARRKRILENSEKRLEKITGAYKNGEFATCAEVKPNGSYTEPALQPVVSIRSSGEDISSGTGSISYLKNSPLEEFCESFLSSESGNPDSLIPNDKSDALTRNLISVEGNIRSFNDNQSLVNYLQKTRIHVILLAVLIRTLYNFQWEYIFGETIFIPFFTFEIAEIMFSSCVSEERKTGFISVAVLLCGVTPHRFAQLNKVLSVMKTCLEDFNLYFFGFVITHVLFLIRS